MPPIAQTIHILSAPEGCRAVTAIDREEIARGDADTVLATAITRLGSGGGRIHLEAGDFPLRRTLALPSRLRLEGSGRSSVLRRAGGEGPLLTAADADGIEVRDLVLDGAGGGTGLRLEGCGECEVAGVAVRDCSIGVHVLRHSFLVRLASCSATGCSEAGYLLEQLHGRGRGGSFVPCLLLGCTAAGGTGAGFVLHHAICINLVGCIAFQTGGHGFHVRDQANSALITGCRAFQCGGDAVRVEDAHEFNASANIFCWNKGNSLTLENVTWAVAAANEFIDIGGRHGSPGIGVELRRGTMLAQITANTIFNWSSHQPMTWAVREDASCRWNAVAHNLANNCAEGQFQLAGEGTLSADNAGRSHYVLPGRPYDPTAPRVWPASPEFSTEPFAAVLESWRRG